MNEGVPRHPGAETMAALLDGTLAPRELAETTAHLRDCADCRTILGETARFERESGGEAILPVPETRRRTGLSVFHSWRLRLVAAAAAAIALLVPVTRYVQYRTSPIGMLIAAAPRDHRPTVARVSGYPWAPPPAGNRGTGESPALLELKGVAGKVLRTEKLDTVKARHGAGVAHLLIGQTPQSVDLLARAADGSHDARVWNDLAAARYAVGEGAQLSALAAADKAIALDPKLAEAYFNRALILEQLGSAPEATKAWERYLELDPSSEWAIEARDRLRKLEKKSADFKKDLERARSDPSLIAELVREFPQEARKYGEGTLLVEWAKSEANGVATADAELAIVREIGRQLASRSDTFLADVVATIDRADAMQRPALVAAHRFYGPGRTAYAKRDLETAETFLREAETAFRAAGSPMAEAAAYYAAAAAFDRNRTAEAVESFRGMLSRIAPRGYRGLAAEARWQLALAAIVRADWDTALREGTLATTTFEQLRESDNAAFTAAFAAHALERMGASEEALPLWRQALSANPRRRADVLYSSAVALAATERPDEAEAVMRIIDDVGDQRESFIAEVFMDRARVAAQLGDPRAAERHLRTARASAVSMAPEQRAAVTAGIDVVQASLQTSTDPRAALATLDRAIDFYAGPGMGLHLPGAYLQRGRAYRAAGNPDAALADYEAALREVEKQRPNLGTNASPAFLDTAAQLIDETIELHLDRGAGAQAFEVADRAHSLLANAERAPVPERTALIEYVLLPKRVAIFCRTSAGLTAVTVSVPRRKLADLASDFVEVIRRNNSTVEEIRAQAAVLDRILIAPVSKLLTNVDELVLVRDRQLQAVPFAALFDGERWLVERFAIRYAPSAALTPEPAGTSLAPAVVIADPEVPGWKPLPHSVEEANEVGAIHRAPVIQGADATRSRFLESLQRSGLVHYAGHADSDARAHGALMLAPSGGDDGLLTANEIARLSLHERSPLVVLSACGTLRGEVRHVAGMPTLARAFLTAGARAVVGTQWEVRDDVTTQLFITFHQELREGQAPARALRAAQIAMLQTSDPRHQHPAAWSAVGVLSNL